MTQTLGLSSTSIVSEVIDGEAIIMDMRSGSYYSTEGVGALIWDALQAGANRQELAAAIARAFPSEVDAEADASRFIDTLLASGLLAPSNNAAASLLPDFGSVAYKAPALSSHDDLRDLILLDPIHDVDDTGWPTRKDVTPSRIASIEKSN